VIRFSFDYLISRLELMPRSRTQNKVASDRNLTCRDLSSQNQCMCLPSNLPKRKHSTSECGGLNRHKAGECNCVQFEAFCRGRIAIHFNCFSQCEINASRKSESKSMNFKSPQSSHTCHRSDNVQSRLAGFSLTFLVPKIRLKELAEIFAENQTLIAVRNLSSDDL